MKNLTCSLAFFALSFTAGASIAPQMINLNMQFRTHEQVVESDLAMPFYQTAEIEKKVGKKNYLISLVPKQGAMPDEVAIEIKFLRHSNNTPFYKKEIIAKLNQKTSITAKGVTINFTPVI